MDKDVSKLENTCEIQTLGLIRDCTYSLIAVRLTCSRNSSPTTTTCFDGSVNHFSPSSPAFYVVNLVNTKIVGLEVCPTKKYVTVGLRPKYEHHFVTSIT